MGKLSDLIRALYGVNTYYRRNSVVGALQNVSTLFLRPHDDRLGFLIVNCGANAAYILNGADVAAANGILLAANGGFVHLTYSEDLYLVGDGWYGIAPGGAVNILVLEVIGK